MLKKKIPKMILVLTCIMTILIQHTSVLLAATLSESDETAKLKISIFHEGGEESSGTLTDEQKAIYDESSYAYFVGDTRVYKITEENNLFADTLYCLDATKSFPAETSSNYTNSGSLVDSTEYSGLNKLLNNMYLKTETPELKDNYLEKAFAGSEYDLETVKAVLSDDDIDVIQQYAIWHFTNSSDEKYNKLSAIRVIDSSKAVVSTTLNLSDSESYIDIDADKYAKREEMAQHLYNYLVASIDDDTEVTYPSIKNQTTQKTVIENDFYKAGPFEISSGNVTTSEYNVKLVDKDGNEISDYNILLEDGTIATQKVNEIFDTPFYIQIPTTMDLTGIKLILDYNKYQTKSMVWNPEVDTYQPVVSIAREKEAVHEEQEFTVVEKGFYDIELVKQDKESKLQLAGAEFNVQINSEEAKTYTTDENGIITIPTVDITEVGSDTIKITEIKAPTGYKAIEGTLELGVTKTETDGKYVANELDVINSIENTTATLLNDKITITVEDEKIDTYKLQVIKRDKETEINLEGADFSIQIGNQEPKIYTTNDMGIIEIPEIEITNAGTDTIIIEEINAPYGYLATYGKLELTITTIKSNGKYIVSNIDSKKSPVDAEAELKNGVLTVIVRNERLDTPKPDDSDAKGKYELVIEKLNQFGELVTNSEATFDVDGIISTTENGIAIVKEVEINNSNVDVIDRYIIKETQAPKNHTKFEGTFEVVVSKKLTDDEGSYKASSAMIRVTDKDGNMMSRGDRVRIETRMGVTKVIVSIVNHEMVDLSLRKYISAVSKNGNFEEQDYLAREPKVDLEMLDNGEATTAKYNHSKETITVKKGNYILYTIRVYNEGRINAMASKVTDYLPEGLEFVTDAEANKIWNYNEETRKLTTNENYDAKLLLGHEIGKELEYQDLQVVCRVSKEIAEDTNIVNIAEISEYKYEDGTIAEDLDSKPENLEYPSDLPKYDGGNDEDKEDDYVPGQEDDDDFERIFVKSIKGQYEFDIVKKDNLGNIISDLVAKFDVNNEEKETENGIIKFENIEINKNNIKEIDKYVIKETEAPNNYSKFNNTIEVEVSKKLSEDEEFYEVDNVTMKIIDSEGNEAESKDFEIIKEDGKTRVVVNVVNYGKVDLSLRKFISAVSLDEKFEEEEYIKEREPKVDLEELDNGKNTTSKYNHSKEALKVNKEDYILFTIRVYNEGKINAIASEITDYLPEGLEFVKDAEENKIWNYSEETRKLTTNENYKPELLLSHEEGKDLSYQDLQVVCKVSADVKEDTNIINIAEITGIKHEDGTPAEDIDSTPNNVKYPENISEYNGGEDSDTTDDYVPGQEDDDDFEKIIVEKEVVEEIKGEYEFSIVKVDKDDKTIKDLVTKFNINDEEKETKDGIIELQKVEINKDNFDKKDTYVIKEIEAPEEYEKFDGSIEIEVSKKLSEDEKSYEVDSVTMKVLDSKGEEYKGDEIATVEVVDGKVIVKVINYKENKPDEPDKPDEPKDPDKPVNPDKPVEPKPNPKPSQPSNPTPSPAPSKEQPKNTETPKTEPKTYTPSTGDILPMVTLGIISLVILINIAQIIIVKRKKSK